MRGGRRGSAGPRRRLLGLRPSVARRVLLALVLLAVVFFPVSSLVPSDQPQQAACRGCDAAQPAVVQNWTAPLPGAWLAGSGVTETTPATGQAYVAVGGGIAVVGDGLTLTAFSLGNGSQLWQVALPGPAGAAIMSVRAWPGAVTAGILAPGGRNRTEVVVAAATGAQLQEYPAAVFGGAVAASLTTTVVVGRAGVTSYDNKTGRRRWYRPTGQNSPWRVDGQILYVAKSAGGYLGSSPVTALKVINLKTGAERTLGSPLGHPFSGTLAIAADGMVLFASASGVTAYSGSTGDLLWSIAGAVPEGADPAADLLYLASAGTTLTGVDPLTGQVKTTVSGSVADGAAGMYVVRDGVALGLDSGANGEAWGYDVAAGRITWTSAALPWPHYFSDLSGLGGSAAISGDSDVVVVAACPQVTSTGACADPELVALTL
jgi:outer membrane protein assembly factor BamB